MDLYNALWGRVSPGCVPTQGMGILIDLKEKRITNFSSLHVPTKSQDGSDQKTVKEGNEKRKKDLSCTLPDESVAKDSPTAPPSTQSHSSTSQKLKLKIKLGEEDEIPGSNTSKSEVKGSEKSHTGIGDHDKKKHKKKKKKKHKDEHTNN